MVTTWFTLEKSGITYEEQIRHVSHNQFHYNLYNTGGIQMNNYVEVEITDQDVERVKTLARKRDAKKVKFGSGRHGGLSKSSEKAHIDGLFGEIAISKYFKIELDTEIYDDHGDAGYDFIIAGLKADVKTATSGAAYREPWLKVPAQCKKDQKKIDNCDIFIACYYDYRKRLAYIQGWVTKETLMNREKQRISLNKGGFGPWNYIVKKNEFKNIRDLPLTHTK